ncbi:MAG: tRNA guanosine(34) transglycosylase Tgt [Acidobacteriota bacterium]
MISFHITGKDPASGARLGRLETGRGLVQTPVFMPVGTAATVKATRPEVLESMGANLILGNTYHLYLRPGIQIMRSLGGLHRFMAWPAGILTDSGGYQVFSHRALNRISEEGVEFASHLDGSRHFFSPERSIEVQRILGSDIVMAFDDCTPYPVSHSEAQASMRLSMRWAERSKQAMEGSTQALFGIVQGSVFADLRRESLARLLETGFDGIAMGGFSVGEPKLLMHELLEQIRDALPPEVPHYLMGVGTPLDIVRAVLNGYDMFDCVLPTRNARNGMLFTWKGPIRIKNARFSDDPRPLDEECGCPTCRRFSRAYLRHLYISGEILSSVLNTHHNLYFYLELMQRIRSEIPSGGLVGLARELEIRYGADA